MTTIIQATQSSTSVIYIIPSYYPSIIYTANITMSTRRTRTQRARTTCQHCGVTGHFSTICPRNTYSPDLPAATCPACIRTVSILADGTLFMAIQPCNLHTTPTAPPPTQPLPTQLLPTQPLGLKSINFWFRHSGNYVTCFK